MYLGHADPSFSNETVFPRPIWPLCFSNYKAYTDFTKGPGENSPASSTSDLHETGL